MEQEGTEMNNWRKQLPRIQIQERAKRRRNRQHWLPQPTGTIPQEYQPVEKPGFIPITNPVSAFISTIKGLVGKSVLCSKCGLSGGTMVKIDDHYEHQDKDKCGIMQFRVRKGG